ncbi:hypothetical protein [Pseudonocardia ailaonensis]|uniref:hypothetical protein n=1 Tax=Pseudonocardia ailaonensis TaxID=367279 RepID=UPI0031E20E47
MSDRIPGHGPEHLRSRVGLAASSAGSVGGQEQGSAEGRPQLADHGRHLINPNR